MVPAPPRGSHGRVVPPQVEPNTKLFPAVFVQPTTQNVLQFELGKLKVRFGTPTQIWGEGVGEGLGLQPLLGY